MARLAEALRGVGGRLRLIYPSTPDGLISAYMVLKASGYRGGEEPRLEPLVYGERPPSLQEGWLTVTVGPWASREALGYELQGPGAAAARVSEGAVEVVGSASHKAPANAASLHLEGVWRHPVMAAAAVVSVLWNAAKGDPVYRGLMAEAGMDPEEDYWVPETVASNLWSLSEACRREGLTWYPRLMALETVEPVKAAFEDALLASLVAQADFEAERMAEEAEARLEAPCGSVVSVTVEGDWSLGVRLARKLSRRAGAVAVVGYRARCSGEEYIAAYGVPPGRLEPPPVEGAIEYYAGSTGSRGSIAILAYLEKGRVESALRKLVKDLCGG